MKATEQTPATCETSEELAQESGFRLRDASFTGEGWVEGMTAQKMNEMANDRGQDFCAKIYT